jgi:hypothetical protein
MAIEMRLSAASDLHEAKQRRSPERGMDLASARAAGPIRATRTCWREPAAEPTPEDTKKNLITTYRDNAASMLRLGLRGTRNYGTILW